MADDIDEVFLADDYDFDPFAVDDSVIDQEDMDDDNPYDTVDFPTMRNMPQHMQREAVFTPERKGSAQAALRSLMDHNPARKHVLLAILDACRGGCASSEVSALVKRIQKDNQSVYAPMTLCRMLERAGGLRLEDFKPAEEKESVKDGVKYLVVGTAPDPMWSTTDAGEEVLGEMTQGKEFDRIIVKHEAKYRDVYLAVMGLIEKGPCQHTDVARLVDGFEVCEHPRRFGEHFIDMLEASGAIEWHDKAWRLTDLGHEKLAEMRAGERL